MSKATTSSKVDYFRLPRPLWRKLKKHLPTKKRKSKLGGRPRVSDRASANAIWYVLFGRAANGRRFIELVRALLERRPRAFPERWRRMGLLEKLMKWMVEYYAKESGGISWKWQAIGFQELSRSSGRGENG